MGQFKPMVKMMTTEPSVELKLKKGGSVKMNVKEHDGHKMMGGGVPPTMPARGGMPAAVAPKKPSMAARRRAMKAMAPAAAPAGPVGMAGRMLKNGGKAEGGESKAEHAAEMKKMAKTAAALKEHAGKPASKAHKGLKKGGMACATGGVAMGQGGYKKGGMACATGGVAMSQGGYKKGGIINTENQGGEYRNTKMDTAEHTGKTSGKTGGVKNGNGGGYKKGGSCYAEGGKVMNYVDGNVVGTPAGKTNTTTGGVKMSNAGGFKKGGATKKVADGGKKGKPAVKAHARRYADGGDVTADPMYDDGQGGMTMDDSGVMDPRVMYAMGSGKDMGVDPRVLRGSTAPGRITTQGPGDGLAPGPNRGRNQGMQAMMRAFRNSPMGQKLMARVGNMRAPMDQVYDPKQAMMAQQPSMPARYATGGAVNDSGKAEKMPPRRVPTPVSINQLSGTYKKGGTVKK